MPKKVLIVIPELHPSINVWRTWHYQKYSKEKHRWAEMIGWLCKGQPKMKGEVVVRVDCYFKQSVDTT